MEDNFVKNAISTFFSTLTDVFGEKCVFEEFKKTHINQTTVDGENSGLIFGQIVYRDKRGATHESKPLLIKIMPKLKNSKFISNSFVNEMNFYTKIAPAFNTLDESFSSLFPQFYHGEMIFNVKEDQSVMIFEDLKARGYQMSDKHSFLDSHHLILMMRKIGQFHAFSYKAKSENPRLFYAIANHYLETNLLVNLEVVDVLTTIGQPAFEYLLQSHPNYQKYASDIEKLLQNADEIYTRILCGDEKNPTSVICHGDFLRNNVMFKYDKNGLPKNMLFVDLATFRFSSPVLDLVTVLYINADQKTRDDLWNTLIDEYYAALQTTFPNNRIPTKSEILSQFVDRAFYAYLVATYFLPRLITFDSDTPLSNGDRVQSPKHGEVGIFQMSSEKLCRILLAAQSEDSIRALSNILRDMIDRGFICK